MLNELPVKINYRKRGDKYLKEINNHENNKNKNSLNKETVKITQPEEHNKILKLDLNQKRKQKTPTSTENIK
jgi:hypothetical protein